jgi:hypothetical protein
MGDVGSALGPATGLEPAMNKTRTEDHYEHCACLWVGRIGVGSDALAHVSFNSTGGRIKGKLLDAVAGLGGPASTVLMRPHVSRALSGRGHRPRRPAFS